jgi:hypothetical protein
VGRAAAFSELNPRCGGEGDVNFKLKFRPSSAGFRFFVVSPSGLAD